jgi:hypothetical protein
MISGIIENCEYNDKAHIVTFNLIHVEPKDSCAKYAITGKFAKKIKDKLIVGATVNFDSNEYGIFNNSVINGANISEQGRIIKINTDKHTLYSELESYGREYCRKYSDCIDCPLNIHISLGNANFCPINLIKRQLLEDIDKHNQIFHEGV